MAVIVLCITIPIGCDGGSSNQASNDNATQTGAPSNQESNVVKETAKDTLYAILNDRGNFRSEANSDNKENVIRTLSKGDTVEIITDNVGDGWSKIKYNDIIGFIKSEYLDTITAKSDVETDDKGGTDAEESTDTTPTEVKDGAEDGAGQTETTEEDTTSIADAEKEDSVQAEPTQPADTLQAFTVNTALVDSLWEQMLMKVYVASDTMLAKIWQAKEDSLRNVINSLCIDTLVLKQIASEKESIVVVKKEGMPCWLAWVIGGGALLLGILPTYFIMRKRKKSSDEDGGDYFNPNAPTPQEVKALRKRTDELDKEVSKLRKEIDTTTKSLDSAKRKLDSAEKDKQDAVNKAVKLCREEKDIVISGLQKEMKLYTERAVFFLPAQSFAQRAAVFFDTLDQLQADAARFKTDMPSGVNADDYNYYLMRIERKFYTETAKVEALPQWRRELQMLAKTGLIPAGGLIDKRMGGGKVKEQEMESTLRMLLYQAVMNSLAGAAVVMSDEMAIMLPQMVAGVKGTDVFARTTEQLKKATLDMGYSLNYVKPFTPLSSYKDVQNVQFTKADVPEGTIFEVMKMAVNFGSTKSNTEVSAK